MLPAGLFLSIRPQPERFEEDKAKKPKKDVGDTFLSLFRPLHHVHALRALHARVSGTSELFVEGRGYREEIDIFPGKPCNNKLAGNVVDLCPVGALLDKDFLFKQRVWLLKQTPSISPVDSGGENIFLEHNEGVVYRIKPRENPQVNKWWISDDTRYSYKIIADPKRLKSALHPGAWFPYPRRFAYRDRSRAKQLKERQQGPGGLYAVLSPMMSCEEAWLLGHAIRSLDPQATAGPGPDSPSTGQNEDLPPLPDQASRRLSSSRKSPQRGRHSPRDRCSAARHRHSMNSSVAPPKNTGAAGSSADICQLDRPRCPGAF
jgi:NADH-quinone oxidoreductase subunit G